MILSMKRAVAAEIALVLVIVGVCGGCSKKTNLRPSPREIAREQLKSRIRSRMFEGGTCNTEYRIPALKRGIRLIDSCGDLSKPVLLSAVFEIRKEHPPDLMLNFFDAEFQVRGVLIENEDGYKKEFLGFVWDASDKKIFGQTIWRLHMLPLSFGDSPAPNSPDEDGKLWGPRIHIPLEVLRTPLKVRLVNVDGTYSEAIEAYVWYQV